MSAPEPEQGGESEGRIERLPEDVINQIAAGEVVERPASVVKELLDNALDAGATSISVEVAGGGIERIVVTDNGRGMTPEDAVHSLERHATSKIRRVADLEQLSTMGFRGEALASIASVSRFALISRRAESGEAHELVGAGGHIEKRRAAAAAPGTTLRIEDLFFNVPARRKFLKKPSTELGHIHDAVVRFALANERVRFRLATENRVLLEAHPAGADPRGRLAAIVGEKIADGLHAIPPLDDGDGFAVRGFFGRPTVSERTRRGIWTFVNGRFVRDTTIGHAITEAYRNILETRRFPVVLLHLSVPPSAVDVNVHPQKTEVRFEDPRRVHRVVYQALIRGLQAEPWRPSGALDAPGTLGLLRADDVDGPRSGGASTSVAADGIAALSEALSARFSPAPRTMARASRSMDASPDLAPSGPADAGARPSGPAHAHEGPLATAPSPSLRSSGPASPGRLVGGDASAPPVLKSGTGGTPVLPLSPETGFFSGLRFVGQVLGCFLVCEGRDRLVLIDQHAAHERVRFAELKAAYQRAGVKVQELLFPLQIELPPALADAASTHRSLLEQLGFQLEPFGARTWAVKAAPAGLSSGDAEGLVRDCLGELAEHGVATAMEDRVDGWIARLACRTAVRAQDRVRSEDAQALLRALDEAEFGSLCPHGRPVFVEWTRGEIEGLVHRT